jgi:hypothetical protein
MLDRYQRNFFSLKLIRKSISKLEKKSSHSMKESGPEVGLAELQHMHFVTRTS